MIIKSVKARRYKCLSDFSAEFGPGMVVVRGPNESGKSTLQAAITDAFFTKARSATIKKQAAWNSESLPAVELELEVDGSPVSLYKDFEEKKEKLTAGETVLTSQNAVSEWLRRKLGCPGREFYLATACINEESVEVSQVSPAKPSSREIVERLEAMLTGAPGGRPGEVIKRLAKKCSEIKKTATPKSPEAGPVASLSAELDKVREKLSRLRQQKSEWDLAAAEHEKLDSRQAALSEELAGLKAAVANHKLYQQVEEEVENLSRELERALKATELSRELARVEKELELFKGYQELEPAVKRLKELGENQERADHLLTKLSSEKYGEKARAPRAARALLVIAALAAAGAAAAVIKGSMWPALAGGAAALILAAAAWRMFSSAGKKSGKARAEVEAGIKNCEREIENIRDETAAVIKRFGRVSMEDCLEAWQEYQSVSRNAQTLVTRISDLAGEARDREGLPGRAKELSRELYVKKQQLTDLAPYRIKDPAEFARMDMDLTRKAKELSELDRNKSLAMGRMEAAKFDPGELIGLEEEEAELSERLAHWERQLRVHEKALEVLKEAAEAVIEKAGRVIEDEMGPIISSVTGGKYEKVRADNDLYLSVHHPAAGDWVGTDELSLATREQVHFAARLALVKLITDGRSPPLLLDDPFSHYDRERLEQAMKVAKEYATKNQVIVFSATDRYDEWADRVISLPPAPGSVRPSD